MSIAELGTDSQGVNRIGLPDTETLTFEQIPRRESVSMLVCLTRKAIRQQLKLRVCCFVLNDC